MAKCFIYYEKLDANSLLCMSVADSGDTIKPLAYYSFDDASKIAHAALTYVILPTNLCTIHKVALPKLPNAKARQAIPYALEEDLAENIDNLHFAYDHNFYKNGEYLVVVINKQILKEITEFFQSAHIKPKVMTIDWFALTEDEAIAVDNGYLINCHDFNGFLPISLGRDYVKDADFVKLAKDNYSLKENFAAFVASRLIGRDFLNLLTGDFANNEVTKNTRKWYQLSAAILICFVIFWGIGKGVILYKLNSELAHFDANIAKIYYKFFPNASQVISPRFRVSQLLKDGDTGFSGSYWQLIDLLSKSVNKINASVTNINYQNNKLQLTIKIQDFDKLESFTKSLHKESLKVKQLSAVSEKEQVVATLEVGF